MRAIAAKGKTALRKNGGFILGGKNPRRDFFHVRVRAAQICYTVACALHIHTRHGINSQLQFLCEKVIISPN